MKRKDANRERVNPATLAEAVGLADELRPLLADAAWVKNSDSKRSVQEGLDALVLAIAGLPMAPQGHCAPIEYRFARAEAEHLYGACLTFERAVRDKASQEVEPFGETEIDRI